MQFPLPYSVDWNSSPDVYERSQAVIDGRWVREATRYGNDFFGDDSLLAVGDGNWESFEAEVPITINSSFTRRATNSERRTGHRIHPHWLCHRPESFNPSSASRGVSVRCVVPVSQ